MANPHNLKVGQELLFVETTRIGTRTQPVTIETLGRKWLTLSGRFIKERFHIEQLESDSQWESQRRRLYLSQAHWDEEVSRKSAKAALFKLFAHYSKPDLSHLSTAEIEEITAKLAGKPKDTQ